MGVWKLRTATDEIPVPVEPANLVGGSFKVYAL